MAIRLDKQTMYNALQPDQNTLYNDMTSMLMSRGLEKNLIATNEPIKFIASKRDTNPFLTQKFHNHLYEYTKQHHGVELDIEIKYPHQEKGLQVADAASWSLFRYHEHNDTACYDIIKKIDSGK